MILNLKNFTEELDKLNSNFIQSSIQEIDNFLFIQNKKIIRTNGDVLISVLIDDLDLDFKAVLNFDIFYKFIKKVKDDFQIEKNNNVVKVTSGNVELEIISQDELLERVDRILKVTELEFLEVVEITDEFYTGVNLMFFGNMKLTPGGMSETVFFNDENIVRTDRKRLSWYKLSKSLNKEFSINVEKLKELTKYKMDSFSFNERTLKGVKDNLEFYCLLDDKTAPPFHNLFEQEYPLVLDIPEGVEYGLDFGALISDDDEFDMLVNVEIKDKKIKITGEGSKGKIKFSDKTSIAEDLNFSINPVFLKNLLKLSRTMKRKDKFVLFESDSFSHIFMNRE